MPAWITVVAVDFAGAPEQDRAAFLAADPASGDGSRPRARWTDCANPSQVVVTAEADGNGPEPDMAAGGRVALRFAGMLLSPPGAPVPAGAGGLLINAMSVSPDMEDEFNAWYDQEHIPALAAVPGALCARRFRADGGGSPRYLAIYHLDEPAVQASAAWKRAANTPWTERMRPHFRDHVRIVAAALR